MAKLNSDGKSVTVVKGDTLSQIAVDYKSTIGSNLTLNQRIDRLVSLNNIKNKNLIIVGQVIKLTSDASGGGGGGSSSSSASTTSRATIDLFGLQSDTDRTIYATWTWTRSNTDHYETWWEYNTGDGVWFKSSDTEITVNSKQVTYTAPDNAKAIKFTVRPVSKTRKVKGKITRYWTASWSTTKTYDFINNPPTTPPVPEVTLEDYTLTAKLENLDVNAPSIQFKVVQDDTTIYKTSNTSIKTSFPS